MNDGQRIVDRLGGAIHRSLSQHCPNCEAQAAEIEKLREALLNCPIIGSYERAAKFRKRQDDWMATTYGAALGETK